MSNNHLCTFPSGSPYCTDLSSFSHCIDRSLVTGIESGFLSPGEYTTLSVRTESTKPQIHMHKHLLRVKGILEAYPGIHRVVLKNKELF